jgi:hypothetical protein
VPGDGVGVIQDDASGLGQADAAGGTAEELSAGLTLERGDLP